MSTSKKYLHSREDAKGLLQAFIAHVERYGHDINVKLTTDGLREIHKLLYNEDFTTVVEPVKEFELPKFGHDYIR